MGAPIRLKDLLRRTQMGGAPIRLKGLCKEAECKKYAAIIDCISL